MAIPLRATNQGGASNADYSGIPAEVTFSSGNTEQTFRFSAASDSVDDDGESVKLTFGNLPARVTGGGTVETVVAITDDDDPAVSVNFGSATYTVAEGNDVTVTVTLSADPERTVVIPLFRVNQGGATSADYSGVPTAVTFQSGETEQSFTFSAANDTVDDDGESVRLTLGNLPPRVSAGSRAATTVAITDDDVPAVQVSFGQATYSVTEGNHVTVTVKLSADPERTVEIPLTTTELGGATSGDYAVGLTSVTFNAGDTERDFSFSAAQDAVDDDGESVRLGFGNLPTRVSVGAPAATTVAIDDDDVPAVTVSFGQATYTVAEGDEVTVTVELSADPERTVAIPLTVTNQGGASAGDYSALPAAVTFQSGETETSFTLTATQDGADDDGESVKLTFGGLPARVSAGATSESVVSIADDDVPAVQVSYGQATYTVAEGDDVTVTVMLSADPERTVEIPITITNKDGASSADYSGVPPSVTFNSGDTEASFTFSATQDSVDDDGEEVRLTFGGLPARVASTGPSQAVVSITDDDDPAVTVSFGQANYSVAETDDPGTPNVAEHEVEVTVVLSANPERTVEIPIRTTPQGGASNADYSGVPATVTFTRGETEETFTFRATADTLDDDGESVRLGFGGSLPVGVSVGATNEAVVSIADDDDPVVSVSFGASSYTVPEGEEVAVTVTLSADPERTVEIPLTATGQGGASAGDYSGVPASVTFASGETEQTFAFSATTDDVDDDGESVRLSFGGSLPTRVNAGAPAATTVEILDDDVPTVTVSFAQASYSVAESDDPTTTNVTEHEVVVTVTLSADPERTVEVPLLRVNQGGATSADYTGVPAGVTFTSGDTQETFTFRAVHDTVDDDGESVRLSFGALPDEVSAGNPAATTVAIRDDDVPTVSVSFGAATYSVAESDDPLTSTVAEHEVEVTVTLSANPERTVEIPITTTPQSGASNADYSGVPATVTFASGETEQTFTFRATADALDDDGESVKLTFGTLPTRVTATAPTQAVVSITDDDVPTVSVSFGAATYTVAESDDPFTPTVTENEVVVTVTLSADPERTVTIPLTATPQGGASTGNYSGVPAEVTFASGETSKSFTFSAESDGEDDDGESVKLTFGPLPTRVTAAAPSQAVVSIADDDVPAVTVSFGQVAHTVAEGNSVTVTVTLSADPERTVEIPITTTNMDGAANADYSIVPAEVTFSSGDTTQTFSFVAEQDTVDDDGERVRLTFGTLPPRVSSASPSQLVVSITDDDDPAVTVSFGQAAYTVVEGDDVTVTVTLSANPERTVEIPLTVTPQGGASNSDYSGVPPEVTFSHGETSKSFTFSATGDGADDDGESVKLTFGTLPTRVTATAPTQAVVSITDDDDPTVTVSFARASYSVAESDDTSTTNVTENEVVVTVTLSADPERTVEIPLHKVNQGGATSADYSGVPATVTFTSGDTEATFTFTATPDTLDDDGESVRLSFGNLPTRVSAGTHTATTVSITDDDDPAVTVSFGAASYSVAESDDTSTTNVVENEVVVTVTLSADPERTVEIPLTATNQGGASAGDYSGVPASVTFTSGETAKTFTVTALHDAVDDDGESVKLGFGSPLPAGVTVDTSIPEGATQARDTATVAITDDDGAGVTVTPTALPISEGSDATYTVVLASPADGRGHRRGQRAQRLGRNGRQDEPDVLGLHLEPGADGDGVGGP